MRSWGRAVRALAWTIVSIAAVINSPAHAEIFTLRDALSVAYEINPQLQAERAAVRAADEEVAKAVAGKRPTVSITGNYGWQRNEIQSVINSVGDSQPRLGSLTIVQPIFDGGIATYSIKQAQALVLAARARLVAIEQSILLDVVTAYADVLRDQKSVELIASHERMLRDLVRSVQDRVAIGELTRTDVSQAQARLAAAKTELLNAELSLSASREAFERVTGRPVEAFEENPPQPVIVSSQDIALENAQRDNPTLVFVREQARAADYALNASIGALLPKFSLQAQYQNSRDHLGAGIRQKTTSVIGQFTVPIYQAGADHAEIRQARERRSKATYDIAAANAEVREAVRKAWKELEAAQASIASGGEQVAATTVVVQGVQLESEVGTRSILDILNAQQELLNARLRQLSVNHDDLAASYRLLAAMGRLTAKALVLPVDYYDPETHYRDNATRWFGFGK